MTQLINISRPTSSLPEDVALQVQGVDESALAPRSGVTFEQQFRLTVAALSGKQSGKESGKVDGQESGKQLPVSALVALPADAIVQRLPGGTPVMLGEELPTEQSLKDFAAGQGMNADALAVLFGRYPGQAALLEAAASEAAAAVAITAAAATTTTATAGLTSATAATTALATTAPNTAITETSAVTGTTAVTGATAGATTATISSNMAGVAAITAATTAAASLTAATTPATTPMTTGNISGLAVAEESQLKRDNPTVAGKTDAVTVAAPQSGRNALFGIDAVQTTQAQAVQIAGQDSRALSPAAVAGSALSTLAQSLSPGSAAETLPADMEPVALPSVLSNKSSGLPASIVAAQMTSVATPFRFLSQQSAAETQETVTPGTADTPKLAVSVKDIGAEAMMKRDVGLAPTQEPGVAIAASLANTSTIGQKSMLNRPVMSGAAFVLGAEHVTESLTLQSAAPRAPEVVSTAQPPAGAVLLQDLPDKLSQMVAQRLMANIRGGAWRFDLQLHPQELGGLDVQLEMRDGRLEAQISTTSAAVREFLASQLHRLEESLDAAGIKGSSIDVALHQGRQENGAQGQGRGKNDTLSSTNSGSEQETPEPSEQELDAGNGLDLFV